MVTMLPREVELVPEWTGLPGGGGKVYHFELSNRLDTALYKTYLFVLSSVNSFLDKNIFLWVIWCGYIKQVN